MRRLVPLLVMTSMSITFVGPAAVAPAWAGPVVASTLVLTATPASVAPTDTVTLSGTLSFADASAAQGFDVVIDRSRNGGAFVSVATATTGAEGTFELVDQPPDAGSYTYRATFAGDASHAPSSATAAVEAARLRAHVTISVSRSRVTFGQSVRVTAHVDKGPKPRTVEIVQRPVGGGVVVLKSGAVGTDGDLSATLEPKQTSTFIARFPGDDRYRPASATARVAVKVILNVRLAGYQSTSGAYKIYRAGKNVYAPIRVYPNHAGFTVRAHLQVRRSGGWTTHSTSSGELSARSAAVFYVTGARAGYDFRVRVRFPSHRDHLGDVSPWLYFRVR
jgi:hypothetical protein